MARLQSMYVKITLIIISAKMPMIVMEEMQNSGELRWKCLSAGECEKEGYF